MDGNEHVKLGTNKGFEEKDDRMPQRAADFLLREAFILA